MRTLHEREVAELAYNATDDKTGLLDEVKFAEQLLIAAGVDKPYLVFQMDPWEPSGGWEDFSDAFATLEEARALAGNGEWSRSHIVYNNRVVEKYLSGERQ
jgi:hypothetical protein